MIITWLFRVATAEVAQVKKNTAEQSFSLSQSRIYKKIVSFVKEGDGQVLT